MLKIINKDIVKKIMILFSLCSLCSFISGTVYFVLNKDIFNSIFIFIFGSIFIFILLKFLEKNKIINYLISMRS